MLKSQGDRSRAFPRRAAMASLPWMFLAVPLIAMGSMHRSAHAAEPDNTRRNLVRPVNPPPRQDQPPRNDPAPSTPPPPAPPPPPPPPPAPAATPTPSPSTGVGDQTQRGLLRPLDRGARDNAPAYIEIAPPRPRAASASSQPDRTQRSLVRPVPEWQRPDAWRRERDRDRWRDDRRRQRNWDRSWNDWHHNDWSQDDWYQSNWYNNAGYGDSWYTQSPRGVRILYRDCDNCPPRSYLPSWTGLNLGSSWSGLDFGSGWRYSATFWTGWTISRPISSRSWSCDTFERWCDAPWRDDPGVLVYRDDAAAGNFFSRDSSPPVGRVIIQEPAPSDGVARYRFDEATGQWVQTPDTPPAPPNVNAQRQQAAADRRAQLNRVYDVVPDVKASVHATLRGEYAAAVTAMRRAASQNADGLVAGSSRGAVLAEQLAGDRTLAQHAAYALNVFDNPPRSGDRGGTGISEQDARFMQAALRAILAGTDQQQAGPLREAALDALEQGRRAGDSRISTRNLVEALTSASTAK